MDIKKLNRPERIAKRIGISLDNLESRITKIQPSENKVTKKEIMTHLSTEQKQSVKFYLGKNADKGLTIQHLDPRQNRYNSVRYQYLKHSGHLVGEEVRVWNCHQGCGYFCTVPMQYFISFGNDKKTLCEDKIACDDLKAFGTRPTTKHLLNNHADFTAKRLGELGVKTQ